MPMTADAERNVNFLTLSAEEAKSRFCEKHLFCKHFVGFLLDLSRHTRGVPNKLAPLRFQTQNLAVDLGDL